ncbi:MAG TPA: hypothetical protein DCS07_04660 [Bdellovibrionales bacterium]|nr:MAG: hypothetical protein A2Z97_12500 [Bdellovibrionales bacterium GWB1_52_6]OFZ04806.1 MAG: hypothetical protein A2X97_13890 [Bdellovibrionales bacterium GWA1_52_35]OFZ42804.1 MAG: hypothetical protein A2070_05615 [Bdellovibrionales bacterium GWC1_52_8]HAR41911.1 hypothetical protein [Bdellovibrionales bacterium]HCM39627.1 hypothetical protein [Bdellovibrionales bacterium]
MWQSPNQRVRAIANARKRERDRLLQPLHFRRVEAELKLLTAGQENSPSMPVRVILNDLSPKGMGMFVVQNLISGQEILITLKEPKALTIKARVIACQEYENESHILSPKTYPYRMGVRFIFDSPEQEQEIQAFCDEINRDYLYGSKAA